MDKDLLKLESKDIESAIEAILFAAGHPVTYATLGETLDLFESQVKKKVAAFAEKYNSDKSRGIMLLVFNDSCQLCTKEQYIPFIKEALGIRKGGNLSASSLEVLAIIAYNEPVTRAFVDMVRKVDSAYIVTSLCEKNLIEPCGRLDAPGRPHVYRTTSTFLRCFGIESLEQLPYVELPMMQNEGEIIPLDIEIPEPRGNGDEQMSIDGGEETTPNESDEQLNVAAELNSNVEPNTDTEETLFEEEDELD